MTVAELIKELGEYPPDALVMFKQQGIIGPVSHVESMGLARVTSTSPDVLYYPQDSRLLKGLIEIRGCEATYFPAAVMVL